MKLTSVIGSVSRALLGMRRFVPYVAMTGALGLGLGLSFFFDVDLEVRQAWRVQGAEGRYVPDRTHTDGAQLLMVYLGSAFCGWCQDEHLPEAIESVKIALASQAHRAGISFKAVGLAVDWSPEAGVDHLQRMGLFDEVAAGDSWANTLAMEYVWSDESSVPATPQVLVYLRWLISPEDSIRARHGESRKTLLVSKVGLQSILEWVQSGPTVPRLTSELAGFSPSRADSARHTLMSTTVSQPRNGR